MSNFSENLAEIRKRAGDSQLDLAEYLRVTNRTVSKWENGESKPDYSNLAAIAKRYCVSVDWLLGREVEEGVRRIYTYPGIGLLLAILSIAHEILSGQGYGDCIMNGNCKPIKPVLVNSNGCLFGVRFLLVEFYNAKMRQVFIPCRRFIIGFLFQINISW